MFDTNILEPGTECAELTILEEAKVHSSHDVGHAKMRFEDGTERDGIVSKHYDRKMSEITCYVFLCNNP